MIELQKAANGIGLAANQLGVMRRVITVANEQTGEIYDFINPRIIGAKQSDDNVYWDVEGCLSHPGARGEVARYKQIDFAAYRLRTGKKENRFTVTGLMSRIIQHEIDHLNGLLYLDLGSEVRNIHLDVEGQEVLIKAGIKSMEEGYADGVD
jgi:peptide deformylase